MSFHKTIIVHFTKSKSMKYLLTFFYCLVLFFANAQSGTAENYHNKKGNHSHHKNHDNPLYNVYPSVGYSQFVQDGSNINERLITNMGTPVFGLNYRDRFGQNHNDFEGYVKYYWSHKAPAVGAFVNINLLPSEKGRIRALAGFGLHYNHCDEALEFAINPKLSVTIRETIVEAGVKVDLLNKKILPEMHLTILRSLRLNF